VASDTPVKSDIPASANQQGYLEIDSPNNDSVPTAPTVGKRTRAGIPACLLFTSVTERNKHAKPNTVTNRMATYRVRAGSIVEPCGRVFHRVEQSPESKECQHLQPAPDGACQIARHMPPLVVLTNHPHISSSKLPTIRHTVLTDAVFQSVPVRP